MHQTIATISALSSLSLHILSYILGDGSVQSISGLHGSLGGIPHRAGYPMQLDCSGLLAAVGGSVPDFTSCSIVTSIEINYETSGSLGDAF